MGKYAFLVQWKGNPMEESTWESIHHITCFGGKDTLREYAAAVNSDELYRQIPKVYRPNTYRLRIKDH
jgi:hypothetical protein